MEQEDATILMNAAAEGDMQHTDATILISAAAACDKSAAERLLPLACDPLWARLSTRWRGGDEGHTLTPNWSPGAPGLAACAPHELQPRLLSGALTSMTVMPAVCRIAAEAIGGRFGRAPSTPRRTLLMQRLPRRCTAGR